MGPLLRSDDVPLTDPERCQFALCRNEQEYAVELPAGSRWLVCSLHVTPVVMWGVPDGERTATIRDLSRGDRDAA